ncbi:GDSL-type esterase/lipase family protein [Luteolibacter sp. LG18]|uniref:GDSL-type esterase/lipase family protein n=1 Tax=Luteolibacter sp. LG18 TaxID=2819286 RepID=UPI002B2E62C7|nr:sialate O-acetylesterase [Luteolibacter sp. LG18]
MAPHRKPILAALLWSATPLAAFAVTGPLNPADYKAPVRIACVGDSITQGSGADRGQSYPDQLQDLLGERWAVKNFGVSGRTLLKNGDFPYWKEGAFKNAQAYNPDAVVIMLGTNDTKPQNWSHKAEYRSDYAEMVKIFRDLPSKPKIFICRPCPVPEPGNYGINEAGVKEEIVILDDLAKELDLGVIDIHASLEKTPELLPDRVHPSTKGAAVMASTVYASLTGTKAPDPALQVKPNSYFRTGAVLQRGAPIPVWGTAPDGKTITVDFAGQKLATTAQGGHWKVTLKPMDASTQPRTMTITGPDNTVTAENVLVGDVWVASGQSNMERQLGPRGGQKEILGWKEEVAKADHPLIRQFYVPLANAAKPVEEPRGRWSVCSPVTAADFTAVGYFFARDLQPSIKVPVALLFSAWGGTVAEAWTSPETLKDMPDFKPAVDALAAPGAKFNQNTPTALYNAMIAPVLQVPVKGVIWYQGEANNLRAKQYRSVLPALIADWRARWNNPKLPFLFVQIAPYKDMTPELREAQLLSWKSTPGTAMVVTADVGDAADIHPANKGPVGARLALAARALAYGEKLEYSGPVFRELKVQGKDAWLAFDHVGKGLEAKDGPLKGFTLAGADGNFVPATAEIKGDKVVVRAEGVAAPVAVRYGWANVPDVNLFNQAGLPATPFRTDVEP